ncbi:putative GMP synthase [glutamine-hydrolyzing] [Leptospira kobayashii]|uniref:GMP synthase (glutamine-hydrolyzing) n=1 Tax=Leptospira kobayashii TaxID=1917830 RepID=A0ABM7UJH2_9LEPT|nr:glutamine-hydrolyzing GMP synthase [Leptospira kobayashii]BDA78971.1 putative GMP synthase [glutamine-hydrolyzing] [Leptospira kobayashii]
MKSDKKIAVIDFGSQYTHLLASRIRRLGAYTEILSNEEPLSVYSSYAGLVLSGGPSSVYEEGAPLLPKEFFQLTVPILGICYGHQLLMKTLGGEVVSSSSKEYGPATLNLVSGKKSKLTEKVSVHSKVWMSHGDEVTKLPDGFEIMGDSDNCRYAFVSDESRNYFGIQFHPEVTHSEEGETILGNFIRICGLANSWNLTSFLEREIDILKKKVPTDKNVFLLVSGGVDSSVAYLLLAKALGKDRVKGLLVDTGFMRKNEVSGLKENLDKLGFDLTVWDESSEFYRLLADKSEPEEKRKIVGDQFLEAQSKAIDSLGLDSENWILGQGTIYPDTIESGGTKHSHKIKTHHNRVPAIQKLIESGKIIEPIAELYKDEVRSLGKLLGLPDLWIERHPFPGPGLVVRMIASQETKDKEGEREALSLAKGLDPNANVGVLPIQSVGVQGDQRSYAHCAVLNDFTKDWKQLEDLSIQITNGIKTINRVVFAPDLSILPERFFYNRIKMDKFHSDLLRDADSIVTEHLYKEKIHTKIWQMPVVLVPVGLRPDSFGIVLRPVESQEAMTANFYQMDRDILSRITSEILKITSISLVLYDLTHKPPGTIEWE